MPRAVPEWVGKTDDTAIPARVKIRVLDKQGKRCARCQVKALRFVFDHILALINGGGNRESNLQALCEPCHTLKTNTDLEVKKKIARTTKKHHGVQEKKPWHPRLKKRMDGTVVDRETGQTVGRRQKSI